MQTNLHSETISNHGSITGIYPRFFAQMLELWQSAFGRGSEYEKKSTGYLNHVMSSIEIFYDLYHEILNLHQDYKEGIIDGRYIEKDINGNISLKNSNEIEINKKVKDFFICGKQVINNLGKSGMLTDDHFDFSKLIFVKDSQFNRNKNSFLNNDPLKRYALLFLLIENARKNFLTQFNATRDDFEHNLKKLNKYITIQNSKFFYKEPEINGKPLIEILSFYYENLLDFIEKIMAYYYGINARINKGNIYTLYIRLDYDYPKMKHKYIFMGNNRPFPTEPCKYD